MPGKGVKSVQFSVNYHDSISLLKKSGISFCLTCFVHDEKELSRLKIQFPVFLKVVSGPAKAAVVHKSAQGIVEKVTNADSLIPAFRKLALAHSKLASKKVLERKLVVAVQESLSGIECFIGARRDVSFGPVVVFGSGGVFAEELNDVSVRLCPVDEMSAMAMVLETRVGKKFGKVAMRSVVAAIMKVSLLISNKAELQELDINPLIIVNEKAVAVDARAIISRKEKAVSLQKDWKQAATPLFFTPLSIALIGASRSSDSVGQAIMRNLTIGCVHRCEYCRPYLGKIFPVNPFASEILGLKCYPSILDVPELVDLAIIAIPRDLVAKAVTECIKKKVKAIVIISAGFAEFDEKGKKLQEGIAKSLERARIPLLGPNCLGLLRLANNLNASFAPSTPPNGNVAFVSQSGALVDSVIDWSIQARYGFSTIVSYGNKAMYDCHDFFGCLSSDAETKAVAVYIEGVDNGKLFFERLKKLVASKPVIILKGGRTQSGIKAASTHTAALSNDRRIFESAVRQSGAFLVDTVEELFDLAKVLAEQPPCKENGIAVISNGGGSGVICSDYCEMLGVNLPSFSKGLLNAFDKSGIMHPAYSRRNPLDIVGDALPQRFELAINGVLKEPYIHGLIVIQTLQSMTNPVLDAKAIVEAHKLFPGKPIISCFMGGRFSRKGMHYLDNMHIPDFNDIRKAVVAMKALIERGKLSEGREKERG